MKSIKIMIILGFILTLIGCSEKTTSELFIVLNPGVDTIEIHQNFIDAHAKAYTQDGKTIEVEVIFNDVDSTSPGFYHIIYQASYQDQIVYAKRVVSVILSHTQSISLNPGIDTITIGQTWVDAGLNIDQTVIDHITVTVLGDVNPLIEGEYFITYMIYEQDQLIQTLIRYVYVVK